MDNVTLWSDKLGIKLDEDEAKEVLKQVKQCSHDLKRSLSEDEFQQIVECVKARR